MPATTGWRPTGGAGLGRSIVTIRLALALVQSLAAAGDRAGALLAGRRHEETLQEELGVVPDQRFTEAMRRLR